MDTVSSWLRSLQLGAFVQVFEEAGVRSMLEVCALSDEQLLTLGVLLPEQRQRLLDSIGKIRKRNELAQQQAAPFAIKETRDRKLHQQVMKMLLALTGQQKRSKRANSRQVVIDKIERVKNDVLQSRHRHYREQLEGDEVLQRLYVSTPEVRGSQSVLKTMRGHPRLHHAATAAAAVEKDVFATILRKGFHSSMRNGVLGQGVYFPCSLSALDTASSQTFRAVLCDVAVGKLWELTDNSGGGNVSIQTSGYDAIYFERGAVSKASPALREDLVIRSPQQALPRYLVSFTLHSLVAPQRIIVVSHDGTGDYLTLGEAVTAASDGDKIVVTSGVYRESLDITKAVEMVAASQDKGAVLESSGTPWVLRVSASCRLSGMTLRCCSTSPEYCCVAARGSANPLLEACDILGPVLVEERAALVMRECYVHDSVSYGVKVTDSSNCLLENTVVSDVDLCGLQMEDECKVVVMNCTISHCKQNGIYVLDKARGVIEGSDIHSNAFPGIAINAAEPVLMRNRIHHNERSGVVVAGALNGNMLLEDNNIFENGLDGIMIARNSVCTVQNNAIFDNRGSGIQVSAGSAPIIERNRIWRNRDCGVLLSKNVNATVVSCEIFDNARDGIAVQRQGVSVVEGNEVFNNGGAGINVKRSAAPKLIHNTIYNHAPAAINVEKKAKPSIQDNEIFASGVGLVVQEQAAPLVEGNKIYCCAKALQIAGAAQLKEQVEAKNSVFEEDGAGSALDE